jgi:hypothetical protein
VTDQGNRSFDDLVIAVYLDTNALLDLLATIEDGFTLVERVTSGSNSDTASERSAGAEFAAPGVFNFFKLGLSGKLGRSTKESASETKEAELTHTYGSLLHRLRRYLFGEGLVTAVGAESTAEFGGFIEFQGVVRPNPFTATFRQLERMMSYVNVAMAMQGKQQGRPGENKPGRATGGQGGAAAKQIQPSQVKAMGEFVQQITGDVEREGTSTILFENQTSKYRALVTLYEEFLRDRSMGELLNREFRVLGKVARHLPAGSPEKVDLIASSGIGGFPPDILTEMSKGISQMSNSGQLSAPSTVVLPPLVEIVPIAIYL